MAIWRGSVLRHSLIAYACQLVFVFFPAAAFAMCCAIAPGDMTSDRRSLA